MTEPNAAPLAMTPLAHRSPMTANGISLQEAPLTAKFILRADPDRASSLFQPIVGIALPRPLLATVKDESGLAALWLGPDEWLIMAPLAREADLPRRLETAFAEQTAQIVNVTDYYTCLEIAGENARNLLMKLTTIDLHERAFTGNKVVGTLFGHANGVLWLSKDGSGAGMPRFSLIIRWSMADYLWCLLAESGRQWGLPAAQPVGGEKLVIGQDGQGGEKRDSPASGH